jgi:hypothetical protein
MHIKVFSIFSKIKCHTSMYSLPEDVLGVVCALVPFIDLDSLALAHPTRFRWVVRQEQTRRVGANVSMPKGPQGVPQYRYALLFPGHIVPCSCLLMFREIAMVAVTHRGSMLEFVAYEFQADREICMAAVCEIGRALQHVAPEHQADREIVIAAVTRSGSSLEYAAPELRADREIVMAAVARTGNALIFAAPELRADREIVMTAVTQDGMALEFADHDLRADCDIVMAAVFSKRKRACFCGSRDSGGLGGTWSLKTAPCALLWLKALVHLFFNKMSSIENSVKLFSRNK